MLEHLKLNCRLVLLDIIENVGLLLSLKLRPYVNGLKIAVCKSMFTRLFFCSGYNRSGYYYSGYNDSGFFRAAIISCIRLKDY